ncbi:hypothetical protein ARMGADRAFT_1057249 [Armillaria gallica]|uniref:Uncharacterized protein n=1 Tax=Armillaria gallica TaxID=47427 RepID=A0A2H3EQ13_ARMGA|nr:hypothetical protein ARMGADRAFT_1057249 [Armillaria gallica]
MCASKARFDFQLDNFPGLLMFFFLPERLESLSSESSVFPLWGQLTVNNMNHILVMDHGCQLPHGPPGSMQEHAGTTVHSPWAGVILRATAGVREAVDLNMEAGDASVAWESEGRCETVLHRPAWIHCRKVFLGVGRCSGAACGPTNFLISGRQSASSMTMPMPMSESQWPGRILGRKAFREKSRRCLSYRGRPSQCWSTTKMLGMICSTNAVGVAHVAVFLGSIFSLWKRSRE